MTAALVRERQAVGPAGRIGGKLRRSVRRTRFGFSLGGLQPVHTGELRVLVLLFQAFEALEEVVDGRVGGWRRRLGSR